MLTLKSVNETLICDHSSESYQAVLSCGAVYYAVQGGFTFKSMNETLVYGHSIEKYFHVVRFLWHSRMKH